MSETPPTAPARAHPLRARTESAGDQDELEETLAVLGVLSTVPLTVHEVTKAISRDASDSSTLRGVSKRLTHLCARHVAREVVVRAGSRPKGGETSAIWDAASVTGEPMVLVATRVHRPVQHVRMRINSHIQNAQNSVSGEIKLTRAWVITEAGASMLEQSV